MDAKPILLIRVNIDAFPNENSGVHAFRAHTEEKFHDYHTLVVPSLTTDEIVTLEIFNVRDLEEKDFSEIKKQLEDIITKYNEKERERDSPSY